MLQLWQKRFT